MNNELVYGYLTESERSYEAEMLRSDLELQRIQLAYEMVDAQLQENFRYAELKVIEENGTYADLNYLYEEANKEAEEKKEGLFTRIIGAIQKFFTNLLNKLRGVKIPDDKDSTTKVPKDFNPQKVQQGLNSMDDAANKIINGIRGSAAFNGTMLLGQITGSAQNIIQFLGAYHRNKDDASKGVKDMKEVPTGVIAKLKNQFDKTCASFKAIFEKDDIEKDRDKFEGEAEYTDKDGTKKSGPFSVVYSVIKGYFAKIGNFFTGLFGKKKDDNNDTNNSEEKKNDNTNNPENKDTDTKTPEQKPKETKDKVGNQNAGVEVTDGNGNKVEEKSADDELFHSIFGYDLMTEKALQDNEKEENIIDEIASILDTL